MKVHHLLVTVLLIGLAHQAKAGVIEFSDSTFNDADWVSTKFSDNSPAQPGSFTAGQQTSGGNQGAWRLVRHTVTSGQIIVGHMKTDAVYDPANDPIDKIEYSFDLIMLDPPFPGAANFYTVLLFQDGAYFEGSPGTQFSGLDWTNFSDSGDSNTNFNDLAPPSAPQHPDFSVNGSPITFGYITAVSSNNVTESGIDNWFVKITTIPEPSTALILVVGGVAMLRHRRAT